MRNQNEVWLIDFEEISEERGNSIDLIDRN